MAETRRDGRRAGMIGLSLGEDELVPRRNAQPIHVSTMRNGDLAGAGKEFLAVDAIVGHTNSAFARARYGGLPLQILRSTPVAISIHLGTSKLFCSHRLSCGSVLSYFNL